MTVPEPASQPEKLWSEDAERAVLSALLIGGSDHRLGTELAHVLTAEMFYRGAHRAMYEACATLRTSNSVIDPVTLANTLQAAGRLEAAGGKEFIGRLLDEVPHAEHAKAHAAIVRGFHRRRQLLELARQITGQAKDLAASIDETYDWASKALMQHAAGRMRATFEHVRPSLLAALDRHEDRKNGLVPLGVSTGLPELDDALGGAPRRGQLVLVCGVPACGKTSLVWNALIDVACSGAGASGFVSAEMTKEMLADSALAARAGVRRLAIANGEMSREELSRAILAYGEMGDAPIYFVAEPRPKVEDVITRCRLLKQQQPDLAAIGVDFLQLLQRRDERRGEMREQLYRDIAYDLQGLAIELDVVLYLLAQPNSKQIASRTDKRPLISDIAGSGGPEEAATIALMLYREKVYNPSSPDEQIEIAVAKNKFGPVGKVAYLHWQGHYVRAHSPLRAQRELEARKQRDRPLELVPGGPT